MAKHFLSMLLVLCITVDSFPQYATLSGTVTSSDTDEGLQGVNIVLKSSGHGTISGLHGEYKLGEIPAGISYEF